jgi:hypothetical protein
MAILIRYQPLDDRHIIKKKIYYILFGIFTIIMSSTFMVLCVKRRYGEYNGPFFPGVCECWWEDDSNPPFPSSLPTNTVSCGPKKMVYTYINSTSVFSGYIQYCSFGEKPTPFPTPQYEPTPYPTFLYEPTSFPTPKYEPTPYPTII